MKCVSLNPGKVLTSGEWQSLIAWVIFKYLLSINRIAKLQSIIWIDFNSKNKTFSSPD
jgi:hypothetical protein